MGMFDEIYFGCPHCGNEVVAQSKSGECLLRKFEYSSVPMDVAEDANRHAPFICKCGKKYEFDEYYLPRFISPLDSKQEICLKIIEI